MRPAYDKNRSSKIFLETKNQSPGIFSHRVMWYSLGAWNNQVLCPVTLALLFLPTIRVRYFMFNPVSLTSIVHKVKILLESFLTRNISLLSYPAADRSLERGSGPH